MTSLMCRFCRSSTEKLTNSIDDDLVIKLLEYLPKIVSGKLQTNFKLCACFVQTTKFILRIEYHSSHFRRSLRIHPYRSSFAGSASERQKNH